MSRYFRMAGLLISCFIVVQSAFSFIISRPVASQTTVDGPVLSYRLYVAQVGSPFCIAGNRTTNHWKFVGRKTEPANFMVLCDRFLFVRLAKEGGWLLGVAIP